MPKYEALANLSAGRDLRLKKGEISSEVDEAVAAPLVAKGLLRRVSAETAQVAGEPSGLQMVEAPAETTDALEPKKQKKGKR